ncbi:MAG: MBL fold metallo-hydrolase [Candidatus Obscuribacterales bacterium]|nr:MBL fold metallo-hydrolase [Steroidobacteraceae bacterium]
MKHPLFATSLVLFVAAVLTACSQKEPESSKTAEPAAPVIVAIAPIAASADVKPFTIGAFQAAALRDGGLSVPNDNKTLAINKKKSDVGGLLTANNLPADQIHLSVQPLIVKTTDKVLLFDTGSASLFGPENGKLPASLAAAGIDPGSVTDIFISHSHGDHIGGLVLNNALAFSNAAIHMQTAEWNSLKSQEQMASLVAVVGPKVVEFQPGADLVPGVKAVDIKGHTPGHSGYLITSGDQSLLYIGDTMHHFVISVQQPDWTIAFDGDAPTAQASRQQLIESSAANGQRIFAVHFPFPGLGKFAKQGDKYVWVAE